MQPNLARPIDEGPGAGPGQGQPRFEANGMPFLPGFVAEDVESAHIPAGAGDLILYSGPPSSERFKPVETIVSLGVSAAIVCMVGLIIFLAAPTAIGWLDSLIKNPGGLFTMLDGLR